MSSKLALILIVLISISNYQTYAQSIGFKGGVNISNCKYYSYDLNEDEEFTLHNKVAPGSQFGIISEIKVNKSFSIETALLLSKKGGILHSIQKSALSNGALSITETKSSFNLVYFNLPFPYCQVKYASHAANSLLSVAGLVVCPL